MSDENTDQKLPPLGLIYEVLPRVRKVPRPGGQPYRHLDDPCWIYQGPEEETPHPDATDYGHVNWEGRRYQVHRALFEHTTGEPIPDDLIVRHECDRPRCCNPAHLRTGTARDNALDAVRRKRNSARGERNGANTKPQNRPRGEKHRGATITEEKAALIKGALIAMPESYGKITSIAAHFGTTRGVVRGIWNEGNWAGVEPIIPDPLPKQIKRSRRNQPSKNRSERKHWKVLNADQVAEIRWRYFEADDKSKRHLKRHLAEEFGVSLNTIAAVLNRNTHRDVAPEIPAIREVGHGMAKFTDHDIQVIRATANAYPDLKGRGLAAALARLFNMSLPHTAKVLEGEIRKDVPDDPKAALPRDVVEKHLKPLTRRGESHHKAKLTEAKVQEILRRTLQDGESARAVAKDFNVSATNISFIAKGRSWRKVYEAFCRQNGLESNEPE